jgi:hypothetical protein
MTDELELLRLLGARLDTESPGAETEARMALDAAISRARPRPARARRPRRRAPAWRLGLVLVLAAVALVVAGVLRSGTTAAPPEAAGAVLQQLARVAAAQPATTPRADQYLYTASRSLTNATTGLRGGIACTVNFTEYRQNWIAPDGQGLFRESDGPGQLQPGSAPACRAVLRPGSFTAGTSNNWAAAGCLSSDPIPLGKLPTDPAVLRARLLTGKVEGGPPGPLEAFTQVGALPRSGGPSRCEKPWRGDRRGRPAWRWPLDRRGRHPARADLLDHDRRPVGREDGAGKAAQERLREGRDRPLLDGLSAGSRRRPLAAGLTAAAHASLPEGRLDEPQGSGAPAGRCAGGLSRPPSPGCARLPLKAPTQVTGKERSRW